LKKKSVAFLLNSNEIQTIIYNQTLNAPQKIERLRTLLFSWKFPRYSNALQNWKKIAKETAHMVLGDDKNSRVTFVPNPAFEKNRLEVNISIGHANAAKEIFEKLSEVPQTTWGKLIYPVSE
jgi:hypothetical protein